MNNRKSLHFLLWYPLRPSEGVGLFLCLWPAQHIWQTLARPKRALQSWCTTPPHFWNGLCRVLFLFFFDDWLWNKKTNTSSLNLAHATPRKANITRDPQLQRVTQILHGSTWQRIKTFWPRSSVLAEPKHFSSWGLHSKIPHKWRELSPFGFCVSHSKHLRKCWHRQLASRGSIETFHQIKTVLKI